MHDLDTPSLRQCKNDISDGFLDEVLSHIESNRNILFSEVIQLLEDRYIDDTNAIGLTFEEHTRLCDDYADSYGIELDSLSLENIRSRIEMTACQILHFLALEDAREVLSDFQDFLEDNDLDLSQTQRTNPFDWCVHQRERSVGAHGQVYEYRNVEGEIDVDVWQYLHGPFEVFLVQHLDEDD